MSAAAFTLSLDCEGLWGMADQPNLIRRGVICRASLSHAYGLIWETLDRHGIKATCAFVSAFAAGAPALLDHADILKDLARHCPEWFQHVMPALESGDHDGWFGNEFHSLLRSAGHEMAWHGGTHLPLLDATPAHVLDLELELTRFLLDSLGDRPGAVVFPRNQVGQLARLQDAGFRTYRAGVRPGRLAKVVEIASEWNPWDNRFQALPYFQGGWQVCPPGHFLNWPKGVRSLMPVPVTVARWKNLLRSAAANGGYVHMWFHPHNLITAPAMGAAFEQVLAEVGQLVRAGDLANVTMSEATSYFSRRTSEGVIQ